MKAKGSEPDLRIKDPVRVIVTWSNSGKELKIIRKGPYSIKYINH